MTHPATAPADETPMKLDQIDIKILYELQKNGRITNVELAELVNLSPSPCLMRVKKLQQEGYITGYSARINIGKLGQTLTVFTEVTLKNHRQVDFARFLAAIEKLDQVIECHLVSGGYEDVALALMRAIAYDQRARLILNVRGGGALAGVDDDAVVEVPCLVDANGPHPIAGASVPASVQLSDL